MRLLKQSFSLLKKPYIPLLQSNKLYSIKQGIQSNYCIIQQQYSMSTTTSIPNTTLAAQYTERGNPTDVIKLTELSLQCNDDELIIQMVAAPINPSDINMIEGTYMIKPELPAIAGGEGVGRIVYIGKSVVDKSLELNDLVIQATGGLGTWCTYNIRKPNDVLKIPGIHDIDVLQAATLSVNPCSAYRMLHDYYKLSPGDIVIQNGANSSVGLAVIQLCKLWNINTINIVRNRDNVDELKQQLYSLGATLVLTEDELAARDSRTMLADKQLSNIKLALNCVGGNSSAELSRHMTDNSVMVTYGGMSKRPVTIGTSKFIFNNISLYGFWLTRWIQQHSKQQRIDMLTELVQYIKQNKFRSYVTCIPFTDIKHALQLAQTGKKQAKVVVTFHELNK